MIIGVMGAGNIGGTLGRKWAAAGHTVAFGVRDSEKAEVRSLLGACGGMAIATSVYDAAAGADALLFAVPGRVMAETVRNLAELLQGKTLIDASNNVGQKPMHNLEALRQAAPGAPLYRAFNNLGWENFADPVFDGVQADLFYCGDEGPTRSNVHQLIADIGLRPVYLGGLEQVDLVDSLTSLWFRLAIGLGKGRHLAFKMIGG